MTSIVTSLEILPLIFSTPKFRVLSPTGWVIIWTWWLAFLAFLLTWNLLRKMLPERFSRNKSDHVIHLLKPAWPGPRYKTKPSSSVADPPAHSCLPVVAHALHLLLGAPAWSSSFTPCQFGQQCAGLRIRIKLSFLGGPMVTGYYSISVCILY